MNNFIKKRLITSLIFTIIAIGLFGISTTSMVNDIFADQNNDEYSNYNGSPSISTINIADKSKDCTPWDPRC